MTPSERLIARLGEAGRQPREAGDGWIARCPAHDDEKPSLSISAGRDGRALLHCFAGCSPEAVVESLGMSMQDLFPTSGCEPESTPVARTCYEYRNADGSTLYRIRRGKRKSFVAEHPG
ncbi:MAG: hypothetical protein ACF8LL_02940, partial [Phycisphaerales bacterium]